MTAKDFQDIPSHELCFFATACCRELVPFMSPLERKKLNFAERFLDNRGTKLKFSRMKTNYGFNNLQEMSLYYLYRLIDDCLLDRSPVSRAEVVNSLTICVQTFFVQNQKTPLSEITATCWKIFQDVSRPSYKEVFDNRWFSPEVKEIAKEIHYKRNYSLIPILRDCLIDYGCDNSMILDHLVNNNNHYYGCWVITRVLNNFRF